MGLIKPTSGLTEAQIINLIGQHAPTTEGVNEARVLELIAANLPEGAQIETGSYVGTGLIGVDNKNTLSFEFEPKFVLVKCEGAATVQSNYGSFFWVKDDDKVFSFNLQNGTDVQVDFSENTLSWYSSKNANLQANAKDYTYLYVAIS